PTQTLFPYTTLFRSPAVTRFKMREAASCSGQFYGVTGTDRDAKVRVLATIINRYAKFATYSVIDLDAHAETWGRKLSVPIDDRRSEEHTSELQSRGH